MKNSDRIRFYSLAGVEETFLVRSRDKWHSWHRQDKWQSWHRLLSRHASLLFIPLHPVCKLDSFRSLQTFSFCTFDCPLPTLHLPFSPTLLNPPQPTNVTHPHPVILILQSPPTRPFRLTRFLPSPSALLHPVR